MRAQYFREIAKKYQTDHHEFDLNADMGVADAVRELAHYSDDPMRGRRRDSGLVSFAHVPHAK